MKFLAAIYRFFLSSRYKVTIKGKEVLRNKRARLFLPNHQALVDPQLLFTAIFKYTSVVPVVTEGFYKNPVLKKIFQLMHAVPVSDLSAGSRDLNVLKSIYDNVDIALRKGENVLLYPSGQITGQGYEKIFNKQSAWTVVKNLPPNAQVIGVRIHGLWGSMWSRAWVGKTPLFFPTFLKSIFYVFANLFFFLPKRRVSIEFVDITEEAKAKSGETRPAFNNFLEDFYNKHGEEPVLFLKHYFYVPALKRELPSKILGSAAEFKSYTPYVESDIPSEVFRRITDLIIKETNLRTDQIKINSNLTLDLNIDSLMLVSIITSIEQEFEVVSQWESTTIKTVEDLCRIALGYDAIDETLKPSLLKNHHAPFVKIAIDKNKNIAELFVETFSKHPNEPFAYDKIMGTTTRKEFLLKAMVVSEIIRKEVKNKEVGIMLPALQSSALLIIASHLAGKIPVMLNWTVGRSILDHCIDTIKVQQILTAKSFYTKVEGLLSDNTKQKCIFFEEKVGNINITTKIKGLFNFLFKRISSIDPNDPAVILFTSGSEALPKAVPLTHRNIVADLWGTFSVLDLKTDKMLLAFLPPFHSFGFTVLNVFPLITAIKTAYSPDPTDSRELLKILNHTGVNTILGTPTFLKQILAVASAKEMKKIRLAITGAESMPVSFIQKYREKCSPGALLLEGYGITECAPVITINPLNKQKDNSVGVFIKGIEYIILDLNNGKPLKPGEQGMILVKGENVFNGYSDLNLASPFVTIGQETYYKTGDLGYVDEEGYLFITGRLKRFIKIGGEMISLPVIENALLEKYNSEEETLIAVEGTDTVQPAQIVLFTVLKGLLLTEVNQLLKEQGFSNLIRINRILYLEEIPVLGTGKTDYKLLREMIRE